MELETDLRVSIEFLPPPQLEGFSSRPFANMSAAAVHTSRHHIQSVPRYSPSTLRFAGILDCSQHQSESLGLDVFPSNSTGRAADTSRSSNPSSTFQFDQKVCAQISFNLPLRIDYPARGIKRVRGAHDVDGPHTAGLCCKKRRLRAELITSRLSQPFSQPATHILNREGAESGDKRFLKMATSVDAIRRIAQLHATSFLRFSVMNRIRKRLGIRPGFPPQRMFHQGLQSPGPQPREVDATAKAPWKPQSIQIASGATYWRPSGTEGAGPSSPTVGSQGARPLPQTPKIIPPVPRVSKPAALPMPASDLAALKERTAPRIHSVPPPVSPELRPERAIVDDTEEDSFAFLHPDFDDYGDDEPEHVYSDFGAIFRAGSPDGQAGEDHSYEEYLDELDGISWVTR